MRFEFWERRLFAKIGEYERQPHEWGRYDCVLFAAATTWCLTQKDAGAPYRGTYSDKAGALRLIASFGGLKELVETTCATAGIALQPIGRNFAQRGDVALIDEGPGLAVCVGAELLAKTPAGMKRFPLSAASLVWAIR